MPVFLVALVVATACAANCVNVLPQVARHAPASDAHSGAHHGQHHESPAQDGPAHSGNCAGHGLTFDFRLPAAATELALAKSGGAFAAGPEMQGGALAYLAEPSAPELKDIPISPQEVLPIVLRI